MKTWTFYDGDSGTELSNAWQGWDDKARHKAQQWANELARPVELCEYGQTTRGELFWPQRDQREE